MTKRKAKNKHQQDDPYTEKSNYRGGNNRGGNASRGRGGGDNGGRGGRGGRSTVDVSSNIFKSKKYCDAEDKPLEKDEETGIFVCRHFSSGDCKLGIDCHFSHLGEPTMGIDPNICRYFGMGHCSRGDQCAFSHWDLEFCRERVLNTARKAKADANRALETPQTPAPLVPGDISTSNLIKMRERTWKRSRDQSIGKEFPVFSTDTSPVNMIPPRTPKPPSTDSNFATQKATPAKYAKAVLKSGPVAGVTIVSQPVSSSVPQYPVTPVTMPVKRPTRVKATDNIKLVDTIVRKVEPTYNPPPYTFIPSNPSNSFSQSRTISGRPIGQIHRPAPAALVEASTPVSSPVATPTNTGQPGQRTFNVISKAQPGWGTQPSRFTPTAAKVSQRKTIAPITLPAVNPEVIPKAKKMRSKKESVFSIPTIPHTGITDHQQKNQDPIELVPSDILFWAQSQPTKIHRANNSTFSSPDPRHGIFQEKFLQEYDLGQRILKCAFSAQARQEGRTLLNEMKQRNIRSSLYHLHHERSVELEKINDYVDQELPILLERLTAAEKEVFTPPVESLPTCPVGQIDPLQVALGHTNDSIRYIELEREARMCQAFLVSSAMVQQQDMASRQLRAMDHNDNFGLDDPQALAMVGNLARLVHQHDSPEYSEFPMPYDQAPLKLCRRPVYAMIHPTTDQGPPEEQRPGNSPRGNSPWS